VHLPAATCTNTFTTHHTCNPCPCCRSCMWMTVSAHVPLPNATYAGQDHTTYGNNVENMLYSPLQSGITYLWQSDSYFQSMVLANGAVGLFQQADLTYEVSFSVFSPLVIVLHGSMGLHRIRKGTLKSTYCPGKKSNLSPVEWFRRSTVYLRGPSVISS
jgi:hypothetical protein